MIFLLSLINICTASDDIFNQRNYWDQIPEIVVCDSINISKKNIEKSISFWKEKNYNIQEEYTTMANCENLEYSEGKIIIMDRRTFDIEKYYGFTYTKSNNRKIESAIIELDTIESNNIVLIIHELGHALGLSHADNHKTNNIMHHKIVENVFYKIY